MRHIGSIRRRFLSLCFVLIMLIGAACAEGIFPSMNQMFGTAMPSIGVALGRTADETADTERGKEETYRGFTYDDYAAFGAYLAGTGAALTDTEATDSVLTATLSARGAAMQFIYDWRAQTATAVYPSGTRPEKEKEAVAAKASLLPPVGGVMPSAQFAVGRNPSSENTDENGITQVWANFTDADYSAFSTYLAQAGATLKQSSAEGGVMTAEISLNASSFTFTYDWHTKTATVLYPVGTSPEREKWNALKGSGSILPKMDTIGKELPSMSRAILREPDATETLADGSRQETYNGFEEADYAAFSEYLLNAGCAVDDYRVEDGRVMVIQLSNLTGTFTFTYDPLRHVGMVVYPKDSRIEAAWIAPTATPKPSQNYYSQSECWSTVEQYFKNLSWKNPSSVTIHSHSATYDTSDSTYTFYIDFSAQNGLGEYIRSCYFITVSAATGRVTSAIEGDYHSQSECWNTAEQYFKNLSWKNPSSVTIYSHSATYDASDNTYTFYIDYSAQNGFGGYNRSYYFITVSAVTGRVTSAFGGN